MMHTEALKNDLTLQKTDTGFALFTTKSFGEGDTICDVTSLWYTHKDKLKQVLSQQGNKALLDKLICVEGLYKGDDAARIFGIRVGCGAWARHYQGVKKGGPNAKIVIKSQNGFTSGLAQLVVSTRNNLGISQDTEICLNYGNDYDFAVLQEISESPAKKFKGALAALFENQDKSKKDEATKDEATRKPEDTEEKPAKKLKKEDSKKGDAEETKQGEPEDSAIIAKDVTAEGFILKFQDGNLTIHANPNAPNASGNKKLPPGSLLFLVKDGDIKKKDAPVGAVPYNFDSKTPVMIAPNDSCGLGGKPLPLSELVEKLKIQIIDQVPEFVTAGQLPAKIATSHKYWFAPKDRILFFKFVCAYVLCTITCAICGEVWPALMYIYIYIYI